MRSAVALGSAFALAAVGASTSPPPHHAVDPHGSHRYGASSSASLGGTQQVFAADSRALKEEWKRLEAERPGVAPLKKALGVARALLASLDEFRADAASPNGRDGRRSQKGSLNTQVTLL